MLVRIFQGVFAVAIFYMLLLGIIRSGNGRGDGVYTGYLGGKELEKAEDQRAQLATEQKIQTEYFIQDAQQKQRDLQTQVQTRQDTIQIIQEQRESQSKYGKLSQDNFSSREIIRRQKEKAEEAKFRYENLMSSREMLKK